MFTTPSSCLAIIGDIPKGFPSGIVKWLWIRAPLPGKYVAVLAAEKSVKHEPKHTLKLKQTNKPLKTGEEER